MKKLCQYLECEWRVCGAVGTFQSSRVEVQFFQPLISGKFPRIRRHVLPAIVSHLQAVAVEVPQQTNNFDCGIYVGTSVVH